MTTMKDEIREQLRAGKAAKQLIDDGYGKSLVYGVLKELRDTGEIERPSVARIEQPQAETDGEGGASPGGEDIEYLRARNAELTEHVVDMSIELVRLQRLLRAQQEG